MILLPCKINKKKTCIHCELTVVYIFITCIIIDLHQKIQDTDLNGTAEKVGHNLFNQDAKTCKWP